MVVDEHPLIGAGVMHALRGERNIALCATVHSAEAAIGVVGDLRPDLVVSELAFTGGCGLELLRKIASRHPAMPVLICTSLDESVYAERALRAGAKGLIMKTAPIGEYLAAVGRVLGGGVYLSESMTTRLLLRDCAVSEARKTGLAALSDREIEVLDLVGRGLSTRSIAEKLFLSVKTIETHKLRLRAKLGASGSAELIRIAVGLALQR